MKAAGSFRSVVEWAIAAAVLVALGWFSADFGSAWIAGKSESAFEAVAGLPAGVPTGATSVPLLLLLDGREIRIGQTHEQVQRLLGKRLVSGEPRLSDGLYGERVTQAYEDRGTRFFVTTERTEPGGPMKVTGIYLP